MPPHRAAADFGYPVRLARMPAPRAPWSTASAGARQHVHAAFLAALKSYGKVMGTEEILTELATV